jgi:t-SNARE complex subunit (syntaxin)
MRLLAMACPHACRHCHHRRRLLPQAIIEETEAELVGINKSLHAVHEIFKDLASMVTQQQEQVRRRRVRCCVNVAHSMAIQRQLQCCWW